VGVVLAILADILTNTGTNLQKLAHTYLARLNKESPASLDDKPNYCGSPIWILGVGLLICGAIGDFLALAFAPQSVVAPLGSLTLVVNLFVARWMHHEKITAVGILATICILTGSFLTVAFASHKDTTLSVDDIFDLYITTRFILYAIIIVSAITAMWKLAMVWDRDPDIKLRKHYPYYKLFFATLNGTLGGHNVLFAKFTVELLENGGFGVFKYFFFYMTVGLMVGTVLTQVHWLNEGLKRFDAIFMVPVSTAFWVFFSVFSGVVTFAEYKEMTWYEIIYFTIGILMIIIGVLVFTRNSTSVKHEIVIEKEPSSSQLHHQASSSVNSANRKTFTREDDVPEDKPALPKVELDFGLRRGYESLDESAAARDAPLIVSDVNRVDEEARKGSPA